MDRTGPASLTGLRSPLPLALATVAWGAAWSAPSLFQAWRDAPFDRLGAVAAAAWALAAAAAFRRSHAPAGLWLAAAWLASFAGVAGELNVALHAALALAAAALAATTGRRLALVALAVSWMPALGWALRETGPAMVNGLRLAGGVAALALAVGWRRRP
jgi:hypothetical protein